MYSNFNLRIQMGHDLREYPVEKDQFEKARQYMLDEINFVAEWKKEDLRAKYSLLGYVCRLCGRSEESIRFASQAMSLAKELNLLLYIVIDQIRLATSYHYDGQLNRAQEILEDTISICELYGPLKELSDFAYHHYAKLLYDLGQLEKSRDFFKKALDIRQSKDSPELLESSQFALNIVEAKLSPH